MPVYLVCLPETYSKPDKAIVDSFGEHESRKIWDNCYFVSGEFTTDYIADKLNIKVGQPERGIVILVQDAVSGTGPPSVVEWLNLRRKRL